MRKFGNLDKVFVNKMRKHGIMLLRLALGIVFLWFGLLKIIDQSPVGELVKNAYPFFPEPQFILVLGVWEAFIGLGLIFKVGLRAILALLWLQMAGTLIALLLSPSIFFQNGNPLFLTTEGEFIVKNLVLIAASIVIGGYEVKPKS